MKSPTLLFILSFLLAFPLPVSCSGQGIARDAQRNQDLDYLIERLEITHPNLYANISEEKLHEYQEKKTVLTRAEKEEFIPIATITKPELRDHIFYLSSDFLEGRLPGSERYKQASCYMASQLSAAGLIPIPGSPEGKDSYFQNVDFTINSIAPQSILHVKIGQMSRTKSIMAEWQTLPVCCMH